MVSENPRITALVNDLRAKGHLPALNANVTSICSLTADPLTCTADMTAVILRDCSLTSRLIATANSALYRTSEPIKTVSSAILLLGFEKIRAMALTLGIIQEMSQCAKDRNLYRFFACSYFAGLFAMTLGQKTNYPNPEELLVAGVLSELPRLLLANAYPEKYAAMEKRIMSGQQGLNSACLETFGVDYETLAADIAELWNMPVNVKKCLKRGSRPEGTIALVQRAGQIADLMFGNAPGGAEVLATAESALQDLLNKHDFQLPEFINQSCTADDNVARFFKLSPKDVDMMVKIAEWGKVNPAQLAATLGLGSIAEELKPVPPEDPATVVGQYLTDLMLSVRRGADINRILLTALEAIYRCVRPTCVLVAFLDPSKQFLEGRFYLGASTIPRASDFQARLQAPNLAIQKCLGEKITVRATVRADLPLPFLAKLNIESVWLAPLIVHGNAIGLCLLGREASVPYSEQEEMWTDAIVGHIVMAFERRTVKTQ
jgi:HD-like signal output (HDOD) protein